MLREASTITDIHNNCDETEVELVSLITEKLPKYRLRADSAFGYNQQDWLQTPVLSPSTNVDLSPEQCEETFKFFILSGDRLSQMTRTYHDIEAVTHLLEEKERDLELAARIGQTLLQKNREIAQRNEQLEDQLAGALEEASQLRHEISLKEDLLNIYADDDTDSSGAPSPVKELRNYGRSGMYTHIEGLQLRIQKLEQENAALRAERVELQEKSEDLESEEQQLVTDTVKELSNLRQELKDANENIHLLTEELSQRNEESVRQQEEITRLLTQIVDMQRKQKQLALENEELQLHLTAANNTQYELTREVQALEDRYQEVTHMLDETREEARLLREYPEQFGRAVPFGDSLAAELECGGEDFAAIQASGFYNPSSGSIQWSSPPSSVTGEQEEQAVPSQPLLAREKVVNDRITQSEPRPHSKNSESFSQRILNTARFVNSVKNHSMNSRFSYVTPRKQERPIPTPLAIPGSNRCPLFVHASPDSTPSSGIKCMSSTPHSNHKALNRSSLLQKSSNSLSGIATPILKPTTPNPPTSNPRPMSLRLQLANKKLAEKAPNSLSFGNSLTGSEPMSHEEVPLRSFFKPVPTPLFPLNFSSHAPSGRVSRTRAKKVNRSWHGETVEDYTDDIIYQSGLATPSLGRPGVPGTEDLERAIKKLALRREGARYMEMEKRLAMKDNESFSSFCDSGGTITPGSSMPSGGQTPPPSRPTTPRPGSRFRLTSQSFQAPKLRIVKPLEGSVTLNQWKYLAERDRLHTALQPNADMPSGVLTRERAVEASRSRDASLNGDSPQGKASGASSSTPVRHSAKLSISTASTDSLNLATLYPMPVSSSCKRTRGASADGTPIESVERSGRPPKKVLHEACNQWNNFASTVTRPTFTDCRVMNPTDDNKNAAPTCSSVKVMATCCNSYPSTQLTMTSSSGLSSGSTGSYLCTIHPFLTGRTQKPTQQEQIERAGKFFKDSTRTCSMELGMAHLFKEHAIKGTHLPSPMLEEPATTTCSEGSVKPLTRPQSIGTNTGSAFTKKVASGQTPGGHIVWNRSLQRTFLLPSLPTSNIFFNLNSRSSQKNPETPPNSPLTAAPTSSSYLLNEILSEPSPVELEVEKKEEGSTFSTNLLSKLAQIGLMGLQGFGTPKTTAKKCVKAHNTRLSYSTSSNSTTTVVSSQTILAKSATAPGSLLVNCRDALPFASTPAHHLNVRTRNRSRLSETACGDSKDKGLEMKQPEIDWAELHGSSGALNTQQRHLADETGSDCDDTDGYPFEMSESPLREGKPPGQSSTPKGESDAAEQGLEGTSPVVFDRRSAARSARSPREGTAAASPGVRPKTLSSSRKK